jgi:hypothetical protein
MKNENAFENLSVPLDRDVFFRSLIRELAGELEDIVGLNEASGFISLVGQRIGDSINAGYRTALGSEQMHREQVADSLVDLKRRIGGTFSSSTSPTTKSCSAIGAAPSAKRFSAAPRCA